MMSTAPRQQWTRPLRRDRTEILSGQHRPPTCADDSRTTPARVGRDSRRREATKDPLEQDVSICRTETVPRGDCGLLCRHDYP